MKYTDSQNVRWFLQALQVENEGGGQCEPPTGCPRYRWVSFRREARKSLPQMTRAINELARTPMTSEKRIGAVALGCR